MKNPHTSVLYLIIAVFLIQISSISGFSQQNLIDSLEQILPDSKPDTNRLKILNRLADIYIDVNLNQTVKYGQELLKLSQKLNNSTGQMNALYWMGLAHIHFDDPDKVAEIAQQLEELAERENSDIFRLKTWNLYAGVHKAKGELEQAIAFMIKSLDKREEMGDELGMVSALGNLGLMMSDLSDHEKAIEYMERAFAISEKYNDTQGMLNGFTNLANQYYRIRDLNKSLETAQKQYDLAEKMGLKSSMGDAQIMIQYCLFDLKSDEFSMSKLLSGIEAKSEHGDRSDIYYSVTGAAEMFNANGEYEKALEILKSAADVPKEKGLHEAKFFYYGHTASALDGLGRYQEAVLFLEKAIASMDSFYLENNEKAAQALEIKYQTEKKEQENQFLAQQNEFLASRNQLYTYIGIGLAIILAILSWLFYKLKKQNQTIQNQKSKLEELNATKDRLFAIIAHDMRNAVHSFRDVTDSIGFFIRKKQPERIMKIAGAVEKSVDQLGRLLDNLLEWALVQRGDMPYQPELLNLTESIREVLENFEGPAQRKEVIFETDIDSDTQIFADKNALETIVRNLVSNALKYSNSGGKVSIKATPQNENALIEIRDNGVGMSSEQKSKLFQPSKNKSRIGTAGEKGSGLGLVLVKELVELNKGKIEVETAEGEGTKFVFSLPKAA